MEEVGAEGKRSQKKFPSLFLRILVHYPSIKTRNTLMGHPGIRQAKSTCIFLDFGVTKDELTALASMP